MHRGRADAALVLKQAEQALADGAAVIFYPEGTATRDPDLWPMVAKTGVARVALATGAPVIPVAHWGTQDILPYGSKKVRLFPRKTVRTVAGKPVDLSEWAGKHTSAKALRAATDAIMADVTALVAGLRDATPPAVPFDMSQACYNEPWFHPAGSARRRDRRKRSRRGPVSEGGGAWRGDRGAPRSRRCWRTRARR